MGYRFNPPPDWPAVPPGWAPPPGWLPDPTWPPPPPGWNPWVSDDEAASESPTAPIPIPRPGAPAGRPAGRPRHSRRRARPAVAARWLPERARGWLLGLPVWARVLLTLLLIALLPWLLIAGGVAAAAVGILGLLRGSLPRFRLAGRPAATAALLLGLAGIGGGSALAAAILTPATSPRPTDSPVADPASPSVVIPTTPAATTPAPRSTAPPSATRPAATTASTTPTATPSPSAVPTTTKPAPLCGAPANPYGYNFCGRGGYVRNPPSQVCTYFNCAPNFWSGKGYMEQCQDGTYSMTGGRAVSCTRHGGDLRDVYRGP
jgi:hypothetical protein